MGLLSNEDRPVLVYICRIPHQFPSNWHSYPFELGSVFCRRHPPDQLLDPTGQRDRPANVVGGEHQRRFRRDHLLALAEKIMRAIVELDRPKGMFGYPEPLFKLLY